MNEIKNKITELRVKQKAIEDEIKVIQECCPHSNTVNGLWQWRVGSFWKAIICDDCGSLVKNLDHIDWSIAVSDNDFTGEMGQQKRQWKLKTPD